MQADRLAIYCELQGLELVETYREAGVSGAIPLGERKRGKAMLARLATGQVKHVVALKLDRLFRDAANALTLTREWDRAGVELHLVDMGGMSLNTSSAMGRMMLTMLAGLCRVGAQPDRRADAGGPLAQALAGIRRTRRRRSGSSARGSSWWRTPTSKRS
jgi:hypothetical protein